MDCESKPSLRSKFSWCEVAIRELNIRICSWKHSDAYFKISALKKKEEARLYRRASFRPRSQTQKSLLVPTSSTNWSASTYSFLPAWTNSPLVSPSELDMPHSRCCNLDLNSNFTQSQMLVPIQHRKQGRLSWIQVCNKERTLRQANETSFRHNRWNALLSQSRLFLANDRTRLVYTGRHGSNKLSMCRWHPIWSEIDDEFREAE